MVLKHTCHYYYYNVDRVRYGTNQTIPCIYTRITIIINTNVIMNVIHLEIQIRNNNAIMHAIHLNRNLSIGHRH